MIFALWFAASIVAGLLLGRVIHTGAIDTQQQELAQEAP